MSSSDMESDSSASSDVDFDDYGEFGYQLEPEYTEEELRQMEEVYKTDLSKSIWSKLEKPNCTLQEVIFIPSISK